MLDAANSTEPKTMTLAVTCHLENLLMHVFPERWTPQSAILQLNPNKANKPTWRSGQHQEYKVLLSHCSCIPRDCTRRVECSFLCNVQQWGLAAGQSQAAGVVRKGTHHSESQAYSDCASAKCRTTPFLAQQYQCCKIIWKPRN